MYVHMYIHVYIRIYMCIYFSVFVYVYRTWRSRPDQEYQKASSRKALLHRDPSSSILSLTCATEVHCSVLHCVTACFSEVQCDAVCVGEV